MERMNAGYVIVKAVKIECEEIVLGYKNNEWVTWHCEPQFNHYFWGHYFSSQENAQIDFYRRVKELAETYIGVAERKKLEKEQTNGTNET